MFLGANCTAILIGGILETAHGSLPPSDLHGESSFVPLHSQYLNFHRQGRASRVYRGHECGEDMLEFKSRLLSIILIHLGCFQLVIIVIKVGTE
jgi:hypothetical protein